METVWHLKFLKNKQKPFLFFSLLWSYCRLARLLDVVRQSRMSNSIFMQLNLVVVFVMIHNPNAMIHKVIAWHFDNLLLSSVKVQTIRISDTGLGAQAYNKNVYIISLEKKNLSPMSTCFRNVINLRKILYLSLLHVGKVTCCFNCVIFNHGQRQLRHSPKRPVSLNAE